MDVGSVIATPSNMFGRYDISLIEVCNHCIKTYKHKEPEISKGFNF